MPDLDTHERTARRLLGLASLLAISAAAILIVDYMIKGQILRKAEEASRELGAWREERFAGAGPDAQRVADVGDAAPDDQGDGAREDDSVAVV